jgi:NAD(P)-dependent dehydrogenase (short-subunit alcohol dehydrogenase family)
MRPVCLITGAGGRLGQALCCALQPDYELVATYRSHAPAISSQLQRRLEAEGEPQPSEAYVVQADLTRREDLQRLIEVAMARYGRIDALINAAADTQFHGHLRDLWQADDYPQSQILTNCIAPTQLVSAVYQYCWKDQSDENARWNRSVVNVSSASGLYVYPERGQAFYGVSKTALNMLTLYLSLELAPYCVRVNAICPGSFVDEPATNRVVDGIRELLSGDCNGTIVSNLNGSRHGKKEP